MDVGVAAFVFISGVSSRAVRRRVLGAPHDGEESGGASPRDGGAARRPSLGAIARDLVSSASAALPLLILGGARVVSQARLNYQAHVSE
jgi:hypothetical protein